MYVAEGKISIHALVKRATLEQLVQPLDVEHFNPRPREEGDQIYDKLTEMRAIISIHALVKRATFSAYVYSIVFVNFNPRPREEGDVWILKNLFSSSDFNPRPREEGD